MASRKGPKRDFERIDVLKGHEQTDPFHLEELKQEILRDGHQRDPIIIDGKTNVILDGHHRAEIFRALNLKTIAVHRVDYSSLDIPVHTWLPTFEAEPQAIAHALGVDLGENPAGTGSGISLIWSEGKLGLSGRRHQVMGALVGKFRIRYVRDEKEARAMISFRRARAFLVLPPVSKEEVIRSAMSGNKLPPKTTRHVFRSRPQSVFVPLEEMSH